MPPLHALSTLLDCCYTLVRTRFAMQKKLSNIGNSLGIIIEKPILELLRIDKDTVLEVSTDGEALILRPVRKSHRERVRDAAERVAEDHREAFEKLAK